MSIRLSWFIFILLAATLCGCGTTIVHNPSFPLTLHDAKAARNKMAEEPKTLQRPVVVLSGFLDPGFAASGIRTELDDVVDGEPIIVVSFATKGDFCSARDKLIAEIETTLPSSDPRATVAVDVITHSMGGLIARYASIPRRDGKRLRIARLFTIATPHRGAAMGGGILPINALAADMDEHSEFIEMIAKVNHPYPIIPYVMLGDQVVGQENAAPQGVAPWWVDRQWYQAPHIVVTRDDRILADIFRRLRGEEPFTIEPPTPLPVQESR